MSLSLLIFILSNVLLLFIISASSYSTSCQTKCGRIKIPFPFGIGVGCYLSKWYEIRCVNNSTAFLSAFGKEVVDITLPKGNFSRNNPENYGSIRIKNPISSKGCSNHKEEERDSSGSLLNFTGSPFLVSFNNGLVAVGCNNTAFLTNVDPIIVGCTSTCPTAHSLPTIEIEDYCNGIECCTTGLPSTFQHTYGVRIDDNALTTTAPAGRECKVAFFTDELSSSMKYRYNLSKQIYAKGFSVVAISWFIDITNLSFITSLGCPSIKDYNYYTHNKASCVYDNDTLLQYATCTCSHGFRGNPFIRGGCKDVNECLHKTKCSKTETCVNLPGDYRCVPKKTLPIVIGFSSGFGVLILIGGIYWLVKFIKKRRTIIRKRKYFKRNGGLLLQQQLHSTGKNVDKTRIFTSKELEKATDNFSINRILGQGGQGTVHKGMLVDGGIVAVKKSIAIDEDKLEECWTQNLLSFGLIK